MVPYKPSYQLLLRFTTCENGSMLIEKPLDGASSQDSKPYKMCQNRTGSAPEHPSHFEMVQNSVSKCYGNAIELSKPWLWNISNETLTWKNKFDFCEIRQKKIWKKHVFWRNHFIDFSPATSTLKNDKKKQSTPVLSVVAQTIEAQAFLAHLEDAKSNCLHRVAHEQDGGYNPFINGITEYYWSLLYKYYRNSGSSVFFVSMSFLLQNSGSESSLRFT